MGNTGLAGSGTDAGHSLKGIIPADAETKNHKTEKSESGTGTTKDASGSIETSDEKVNGDGKEKVVLEDPLGSDDEMIDQDQLKRGELEG